MELSGCIETCIAMRMESTGFRKVVGNAERKGQTDWSLRGCILHWNRHHGEKKFV